MLFQLAGLFAAPAMAGATLRSPSLMFFALSVADLNASVAWYAKMFDLKPNKVHESDEVARLRERGATFKGRVVSEELLRARRILVLDNEGHIIQLFEQLDDTRGRLP